MWRRSAVPTNEKLFKRVRHAVHTREAADPATALDEVMDRVAAAWPVASHAPAEHSR
jgi:hypothetical protein